MDGRTRIRDNVSGEGYSRGLWKCMFGMDPPSVITSGWGLFFAVSREAIQRRGREFYMQILKVLERINHVNPEGHYMERFWLNIFVRDNIVSCLLDKHEVSEGKVDCGADQTLELLGERVFQSRAILLNG